MKSWKVEAAIIAVGLLLLGIMVKGGINNFVDKDRVVSVKGLAEMEVDRKSTRLNSSHNA